MIPTRLATVDDDTRARLVRRVMARDQLTEGQAVAIVNRLSPADLTRLELEARDHERPPFTSDYDPFAR
jgi:hypothetical protein